MRQSLFAFAVSITLSVTANAANLYVATSGNDASAGTIDAPFRTVSKAALVAQPGDTVNVRGGVYYERVRIPSKGTASARIVFRSYPGERATIDGRDVAANTAVVHITSAEYVDFSGFEVRNGPFIGINLWYSKQIRVLDNDVHDFYWNGIYSGADSRGFASDVTVSNNSVHNVANMNQYHTLADGGWPGAVVLAYTDRTTVTRNRIFNNDGEGLITLRSDYATIQKNELFDNYSCELYLDNARFVTADGNLIYSTGNSRWFRGGYPAAGIAIANETQAIMNPSSDNTFTNNIVIGTRWGFYYGNFESGGGLRNTKVMNNTFYGTKQSIVNIEADAGHANSVIQNNIFFSTGSSNPTNAGTNGVTYRNNLWYGGNAGAAAGTGDVIGNPRFANAGGLTAADYKLVSGSMASATAVDLTASVKTDYFGATRVAPFDIGAHQLSGGLTDVQAPSIPLDLRAAGGNASSVTLIWAAATDNVGVTGYTVVRNGVTVATVTAPTWTDTSVAEGTLYGYQVQAFDAAGNRSALTAALSIAWSSSHAAGGDTVAPSKPINFRAENVTATSANLLWNSATDNVGVTAYEVFRDGVRIASSARRTFSDPNLRAGTIFTYYVVAVDEAGNRSAQSATITVQTPGTRARATRH
ncbi:MAG TPA: right-handed parallel beta-helix repeat-containing protein [Thermoanaerobaculia bacterium]|jgi:parallel beta-helix repeat protein|nr:right-handed parallel beta-helix repeat-containing protein [Thermoanaerobaculia bacterium]